jgi:hypothetical protein
MAGTYVYLHLHQVGVDSKHSRAERLEEHFTRAKAPC